MTETGPDRPAPRWGEYATPEEVAALHPQLARKPEPEPVPPPVVPPVRRGWDAPLTIGLLVLGAWNVLGSIPGYLDFGSLMHRAATLAGFTGVTVAPSAHAAGIVAIVVNAVLLAAAIAGSLILLRRHRRAVWVPLAAGALSLITVTVIGVIVLNASGIGDIVQHHS